MTYYFHRVMLKADKLPLCDDPTCVPSDRAGAFYAGFYKIDDKGEVQLARANDLLVYGSIWVSSGEDMLLIVDAAIPHPMCRGGQLELCQSMPV